MLDEMHVGDKRFVGLRSALDTLGGSVVWDNAQKQATIDLNGKSTVVTMADENAEFDGRVVKLSAAPMLHDGKLYVPEDFFGSIIVAQLPI